MIKLILVSLDALLTASFKTAFKDMPDCEVFEGSFTELSAFDCMVSAGNAFGLMDGGVDAAIISFFGEELMHRVQNRILDDFLGEQPVGTSIIVETHHPKHPFLAHTPTMRVPMEISRTDNVYRAMWAMLLAVHQHNMRRTTTHKIKTVACPGLGTGAGHVPAKEAARQMALAYRYYLKPPHMLNWHHADERQQNIRYGGNPGFDFPPE